MSLRGVTQELSLPWASSNGWQSMVNWRYDATQRRLILPTSQDLTSPPKISPLRSRNWVCGR